MMKATRRTQPMRKSSKRAKTHALRAAQKGAPAYMENPMDARRKAQRKRGKRTQRRKNPLFRIYGVRR